MRGSRAYRGNLFISLDSVMHFMLFRNKVQKKNIF